MFCASQTSIYLASLGFEGSMLNTEGLDMTCFAVEASWFKLNSEGRGPVDGEGNSPAYSTICTEECVTDVSGEVDVWDS